MDDLSTVRPAAWSSEDKSGIKHCPHSSHVSSDLLHMPDVGDHAVLLASRCARKRPVHSPNRHTMPKEVAQAKPKETSTAAFWEVASCREQRNAPS